MPYDLCICDIDGCLAAEDGGPFDLARLTELARYNQPQERPEGPLLTVCTGRPLPFAEAMCRILHNNDVPCIAENGVWLYHPATNRYDRDPSITAAHLQAVNDAAQLLEERYASAGFTQQPAKTASVTLYHPQREQLHRIMPEVETLLTAEGFPFRVSMTWDYINCDLSHISKASGLRRFFAETDFDPARTMALGDTTGDIPMAEATAWFGCPANASEGIKKYADYVSPYEQAAGVIDILAKGQLR